MLLNPFRFGSGAAPATVVAAGIASGETFGQPAVVPSGTILTAGIASAEAFGQPGVTTSAGSHRYWRINKVRVDGSFLEVSELRLTSAGTDQTSGTISSSDTPTFDITSIYNGSLSDRCYWSASVAEASGFYIQWDFGAGNEKSIDGFKQGGFDTANRAIVTCALEYSDNGSTWTYVGSAYDLVYPGNNALSANILFTGGTTITNSYTTGDLVFMLDAGRAASYGGSGTLVSNVIASPADGSAQADYDYNATAAMFIGPAGNSLARFIFDNSPSAYFNFITSTGTTFLKNMHKSGSKFTVEIWMRWNGTESSGITPLFDSGTSDQGGSDMSRGVMYADLGNGITERGHSVRVKRDSSAATALAVKADASISANAYHMLACSIDGTGSVNSFLYKDGAYDPVSSANTWSGTFSSPGTSDAANRPRLGTRGDATQVITQGAQLFLIRVYDTNLSKAQLDANWDNDRARFGL